MKSSIWSCLRVVAENKSITFQFDRTVFGCGFSIMGHFSLPKTQLISGQQQGCKPKLWHSDKAMKGENECTFLFWKQDLCGSLRKKEIQQNKNATGILFTPGTIKIRIAIINIANLVLWESRNLTAYLCTCCLTVSIWLPFAYCRGAT